jgi:UDP-glucose 4-epimerase
MHRVLVTGSEGFIGKHLCKALQEHPKVEAVQEFDWSARFYENINLPAHLIPVIREFSPTVIYHLAAETGVKYSQTGSSMHMTNVTGTYNVLNLAPRNCRVVLTSSVHCEGKVQSVYAATKVGAEKLIEAFSQMDLVQGVTLRLTSVVGKGMTHGVVKDFIEKLRSNSKELEILGEFPGSSRPYVHIDDVITTLLHFGINRERVDRWIRNVCPYNSITIDKVADIVMETMSIRKPKLWLGKRTDWLGDRPVLRPYSDIMDLKYDCSIKAITQAVKDVMQ